VNENNHSTGLKLPRRGWVLTPGGGSRGSLGFLGLFGGQACDKSFSGRHGFHG